MSKVVRFHHTGGPEVLQIDDVDVRAPAAGEVRIKVKALELNRTEDMYRSAQYTFTSEMPAILGYESAGTVESVVEGVFEYAVGDEVNVRCLDGEANERIAGNPAMPTSSISPGASHERDGSHYTGQQIDAYT